LNVDTGLSPACARVFVYRRAAVNHGLAQGASPAQRRIALVERGASAAGADERAQHAMRLLDTMLWVLKGTTRDAWATATPDEADIVVVLRGADSGRAASWKARGKLVVEIVHAVDSPDAAESNVLAYPFPATRVLELLEKLSGQLDQLQGGAIATARLDTKRVAPASVAAADRWNLVESLRTLRAVRNDDLWMVARDGGEPMVWLRGDGSAYFALDSFARSLRTDVSLVSRLDLRDGYPPPKSRVVERPGTEFFWYAGFNAGEILAPWLSATRRHRITSWPDFGVIRPEPGVLRVVALLAAESLDLKTLAARARVSLALASRVCNALSMCEVLTVSEAATTQRRSADMAQPRGGFTGFLRRLRSHLGIGEAA
jgi:hypothetical protein